MKREFTRLVVLLVVASIGQPGCRSNDLDLSFCDEAECFETVAIEIEYPDVESPCDFDNAAGPEPLSISDSSPVEYRDMTLEEAISEALVNSKVLRELGGSVLRSPNSMPTSFDPAIQESDPRFGVEGTLSAFDADFASSLFFEKNDRRLNNTFLGSNGSYQQDYDVFQAALSKRAVTGSQFTLRKNVDFDKNNSQGNQFANGGWNAYIEGEARHPLLQGGGITFNRIAGPGAEPGMANGVLIARVNTDISLAEFEMGLRNFVSNVENAYWDLYFAYRDLDAKVKARDAALDTWRKVAAQHEAGGAGAGEEAQARTQYYRFQEEVQNALTGQMLESTHTNNGSSAGTFRAVPGVQIHERKLRRMIGLAINDGTLIRPADEPTTAPCKHDWQAITEEALARRSELRRQKWQIKRNQMELLASKNHLLPNLDLVGRYRWRGFGDDLINSDRENKARFDNAYRDLTGGDFQEWQVGVEFSVPIGFRQAHAGVRNAELRLARSRALLADLEQEVIHNLSNSAADVDRAYEIMQTRYWRDAAAKDQLNAITAAFEDRRVDFFVLLDAQRHCAEAESQYYRARVEYALALRNLEFEKGSLLAYCGVVLSEGAWPTKAYVDAAQRERLRGRSRPLNYTMRHAPVVSQGTYPQQPIFDTEYVVDQDASTALMGEAYFSDGPTGPFGLPPRTASSAPVTMPRPPQ